jgi:hypothetical protein
MANKLDIFVLLTGSNGYLGQKILRQLVHSEIRHTLLLHTESIEEVNWNPITHIINCAAVLPANNRTLNQYYSGNVTFIENLLPHLKGKIIIHFSTSSMFYRYGEYQISKMIGDLIFFHNRHNFKKLEVITLPTLNDKDLIDNIVLDVENRKNPIVDDLTYHYCDPNIVAQLVVDNLGQNAQLLIPFQKKNLYNEVTKRVNIYVKKGALIQRNNLINNFWSTSSEAKGYFAKLFTTTTNR